MSDVRPVLFDLDDTLFDHSHATERALARLRRAEPALAAWTSEELQTRHGAVLETLHQEVLAGALSIDAAREERFRRLLTAASSRNWPRAGPPSWPLCIATATPASGAPCPVLSPCSRRSSAPASA